MLASEFQNANAIGTQPIFRLKRWFESNYEWSNIVYFCSILALFRGSLAISDCPKVTWPAPSRLPATSAHAPSGLSHILFEQPKSCQGTAFGKKAVFEKIRKVSGSSSVRLKMLEVSGCGRCAKIGWRPRSAVWVLTYESTFFHWKNILSNIYRYLWYLAIEYGY